MKAINKTIFNSAKFFAVTSLFILSSSAFSGNLSLVIDDFNNESDTNSGIPRVSISDTTAGGKTTTELTVSSGVIQIKGEIVPPRGQPGWSSLILPLGTMGEPQDAREFAGIQLLVKVNSGNISISANSSEVTNFDYHAAPVIVRTDGKFHKVKIPFNTMKRTWSAQTQLNTQTLNSLSIIAFGLQKTTFDFEVDKVSFY